MFKTKKEKIRFFVVWTSWSAFIIPVGSIVGFIININMNGKLGYGMDQIGPSFLQTVNYCIWVSIIGAIISLKQWLIMRKHFQVSSLWIPACIAGFIIGESLAGIILYKMGIERTDLGWAQGGSILAETLIFLGSGALIGLFQFTLLKKACHNSGIWILVSAIAWATVPLAIVIFGGLTMGVISASAFIWILQTKEHKV